MKNLATIFLLLVVTSFSQTYGSDCVDDKKCISVNQCPSNFWYKVNCKNLCGLCGVCVDLIPHCYLALGTCHYPSIGDKCKRTCGLCKKPSSTKRPPTTTDSNPLPSITPPKACGRSMVPSSRVVGGTQATPHSWPWQVGLFRNNSFSCGGSLINNQWVVTAAHCLKYNAHIYSIRLGDHDRATAEKNELTVSVTKYINHEHYIRKDRDIALIKLSRPVMFNEHVQPVCLPDQGEKPSPGSKCYITGWGKTTSHGTTTNYLQELALTVQTMNECARVNGNQITTNMICAGNSPAETNNTSQSGCHGDSGGPFVCKQADGSWKLHGAVSWGSSVCDSRLKYSVFARVAEFRDWINDKIANN